MVYLAADGPPGDGVPLECVEELPEEHEVLPDDGLRRELEDRNIVRRVVHAGREVQFVSFIDLAGVERVDRLGAVT